MKSSIRFKLSFMMFLEFFVWGGWFVTLATYLISNLQANDAQISSAFSTQCFGAIIAPFIIGLIADRYFNAERILGILHIAGALLMFKMYTATDFAGFYPYVFVYMILYMPTLALVNSVSFNQMTNPEKDFGNIRVWGTLGWIVAGLLISYAFHWDNETSLKEGLMKNTFLMTAIASLALGLFSFALPKTPPKAKKGEKVSIREVLGLDALKLLKDRNYLIFFVSSVLICVPLAFYYQYANTFLSEIGLANPTGKMTFGQMSEVLFMLLLPVFFTKFGLKKTLILAMAAWVIRYLCFAYGNAGELSFMLIIGIALHGACYDFFFVTGQIYTDNKAGEKHKSAAQGLITLATYGVGMLVGFYIAGVISEMYKSQGGDTAQIWQHIWTFPAIIAFIVMALFAIFFKTEKKLPVEKIS
ncbi:MFS transporter [Arachidicoccus ginsenosidivorans]|uniref:MFS transporter n=1 Tax=Arachidicoccus ginsenosidivorans TaxID=496057 RepID=A0A5B8VKZ3_9BACT|nr:nucleoside permease [Arachidicoccus ginsenosidivorans]QEC71691.1 MFS transporter [Arachidicoccus ginsenosidivorans]